MSTGTIPESAADLLSTWRWRVFAATWLSYAGYYFCRKPFYITKSSIGREFGWDAGTLGYVGTGYLLAYSFGQFAAGWMGSRWGPRLLVLSGMAISLGANIALGITNSLGTFAAFMIINGLAQATGWPGNVGTMGSWFHRQERGTVMGFWATNFQVGGVAANALAAWVLGAWGFRYSFFSGSIVLLLVWFFFLINQRNRPEDLQLPPITDPEIPNDPQSSRPEQQDLTGRWTLQVVLSILIIGVFYFFVKFIRYAVWSWAPYMLNKNLGMKPDEAGYLATAFEVAGVVGVVTAGRLSDRYFRARRVRVSFLFIMAMTASCLLLYLIGSTSPLWFGVCISLIGFTLYGPDALMSAAGAIDAGSRRHATMAVGIINGLGSLGPVAQELFLGKLLDRGGPSPVFATLMASSVMALGCLGVLLWRNRTGRADL